MKSLTPILIALIVATNIPLLTGSPSLYLIFQPDAVMGGQWWRLFTHPFVHVSIYHLILDAGAFLLLWMFRPDPRTLRYDITVFLTCAIGSLAGALWFGAYQIQNGFCGLSGIAHGLMAYQGIAWAIDKRNDPVTRKFGWIMAIMIIGKSSIENATGTVIFRQWHLGDVGAPIPACHFGGAIAGMAVGYSRMIIYTRDLKSLIKSTFSS